MEILVGIFLGMVVWRVGGFLGWSWKLVGEEIDRNLYITCNV